jgi:hypothetical protein
VSASTVGNCVAFRHICADFQTSRGPILRYFLRGKEPCVLCAIGRAADQAFVTVAQENEKLRRENTELRKLLPTRLLTGPP